MNGNKDISRGTSSSEIKVATPQNSSRPDPLGGHQGPLALLEAVKHAVLTFDQASARSYLHDSRSTFLADPENIVKCVDVSGNTLLHLAVQPTDDALVYILNNYNGMSIINQTNFYGKTALHLAARNNYVACAKVLLDRNADMHIANNVFSPVLHTAAACNAVECVHLFLDRAVASVNETDRTQCTALHKACTGEGTIRVVQSLLARGAHVNHPDSSGATPLHYAARAGRIQNVQQLLEHKDLEIDAEAHSGNTALHDTASRNHVEIFELLVRHGASPLKKNDDGNIPLHLAAMHLPLNSPSLASFVKLVVRLSGEEALQVTNAMGKKPIDLVHRMHQNLFVYPTVVGSPLMPKTPLRPVDAVSEESRSREGVTADAGSVPDAMDSYEQVKKALLEQRRREEENRQKQLKEQEEIRKREDEERQIRMDTARMRAEEIMEQKLAEEEAQKSAKNAAAKKRGK